MSQTEPQPSVPYPQSSPGSLPEPLQSPVQEEELNILINSSNTNPLYKTLPFFFSVFFFYIKPVHKNSAKRRGPGGAGVWNDELWLKRGRAGPAGLGVGLAAPPPGHGQRFPAPGGFLEAGRERETRGGCAGRGAMQSGGGAAGLGGSGDPAVLGPGSRGEPRGAGGSHPSRHIGFVQVLWFPVGTVRLGQRGGSGPRAP